MRWPIVGCSALAVAGAGGCTIADVTTPAGEDRLVVEAVLRTDTRRQAIVLHRSVEGDDRLPAETGAEVVVTAEDGTTVRFQPAADRACLSRVPADFRGHFGACYVSPAEAGYWVVPGRSYELRVETGRGEVARGRTRVPGAFSLVGLPFRDRQPEVPGPGVRLHRPSTTATDEEFCRLPASTVVPVTWTRARGAWGYIAPLQIHGLSSHAGQGGFGPVSDPLELTGVSVSSRDTTLLLPSQFGVFDRFELDQDLLRFLQGGLPDGVILRLTVAAADRNYINGVRGGSFNPSGQVRISSVVGDGVGVFGSLVPLAASIVVGNAPEVPRCGTG